MTRRARFTKSEMDRLFSAAKSSGVHVRIVPTRDSLIIETIDVEREAVAPIPRGLRVLEAKDIIL